MHVSHSMHPDILIDQDHDILVDQDHEIPGEIQESVAKYNEIKIPSNEHVLQNYCPLIYITYSTDVCTYKDMVHMQCLLIMYFKMNKKIMQNHKLILNLEKSSHE